MPVLRPKALIENRVDAIRRYHESAGTDKAELDLSGGIDSAVMACLLVKALGPENIILVHSRFKTSGDQTARARRLAKGLGVPLIDFDGTEMFTALMVSMKEAIEEAYGHEKMCEVAESNVNNPVILGSIRSCLRAPIGRGFNRMLGGGIRHGTGNECEDRFLRFYQKGGDGEVDTNPIEMLSKTEVYQLAFALAQDFGGEVKEALIETIKAVPSPDLWGNGNGHTDEAELKNWLGVPFTYGRINPETGEILSIGTIERVARFLDETDQGDGDTGETYNNLFTFYRTPERVGEYVDFVLPEHPHIFMGMTEQTTPKDLLLAARKAEAATRHKSNTNIPTLGTRNRLIDAGILTNNLKLTHKGKRA